MSTASRSACQRTPWKSGATDPRRGASCTSPISCARGVTSASTSRGVPARWRARNAAVATAWTGATRPERPRRRIVSPPLACFGPRTSRGARFSSWPMSPAASPFRGGLATARVLLRDRFGHPALRIHQLKVLGPLLAGRSVLAVLPTGAGKSLCFQLPALMTAGLTLVVSPLISLMQDQVGALRRRGIAAAYLNSLLSAEQRRLILDRAVSGQVRILYCAPERLGARAGARRRGVEHRVHSDAPPHGTPDTGALAYGSPCGPVSRRAHTEHAPAGAASVPQRSGTDRRRDERVRNGHRQGGCASRGALGAAPHAGGLLSGSGARRSRRAPLRVCTAVAWVRLRVERRHSGGTTLPGYAHLPPQHAARIFRRARADLFRMRRLWCRKLPPLNLGGALLPIRGVAVRGWPRSLAQSTSESRRFSLCFSLSSRTTLCPAVISSSSQDRPTCTRGSCSRCTPPV